MKTPGARQNRAVWMAPAWPTEMAMVTPMVMETAMTARMEAAAAGHRVQRQQPHFDSFC